MERHVLLAFLVPNLPVTKKCDHRLIEGVLLLLLKKRTFNISDSLYVRSSSPFDELSTTVDGLTHGGGTGKTVTISHSGRANTGSSPR